MCGKRADVLDGDLLERAIRRERDRVCAVLEGVEHVREEQVAHEVHRSDDGPAEIARGEMLLDPVLTVKMGDASGFVRGGDGAVYDVVYPCGGGGVDERHTLGRFGIDTRLERRGHRKDRIHTLQRHAE